MIKRVQWGIMPGEEYFIAPTIFTDSKPSLMEDLMAPPDIAAHFDNIEKMEVVRMHAKVIANYFPSGPDEHKMLIDHAKRIIALIESLNAKE